MATLIQCDRCGKTEATYTGLIGWWTIDAEIETPVRFGEQPPPYTLCSWGCVELFAMGQREKEPKARGEM